MVKLTLCLLATYALFASAAPTASTTMTISSTGTNAKYTLSCNPIGGNHPRRQEACNVLKRCNGNLNAITPSGTICTAVHAPVTVTVEGTYGGKPVYLKKEFTNACVASAQLGPLAEI
ncbi:Subtilisin inhibitor-like protein 1 [Choanephora cucurbitarum]|uniref:Subtilisin inhibitor-like protein 1 n=1 Tax=Choanephora cucurbitarum TaxID=101091 RepID=A0A1C7NIW1_9FUNG|nr:Subtilisin inhibitor-like protein 1 [Choanephora cucurbitarum]